MEPLPLQLRTSENSAPPHFAHGSDDWVKAADILFVTDSAELPAHSIIVRWLSKYFDGLLTDLASGRGRFTEATEITKIPLPDSSSEDTQLLLSYMYSRAPQQLVASLREDQIMVLLQLADKYDISTAVADIDAGLTVRVKTHSSFLRTCSVVSWAEIAEMYSLKHFLAVCQDYITQAAAAVTQEPSFPGRLSGSTLAPALQQTAAAYTELLASHAQLQRAKDASASESARCQTQIDNATAFQGRLAVWEMKFRSVCRYEDKTAAVLEEAKQPPSSDTMFSKFHG